MAWIEIKIVSGENTLESTGRCVKGVSPCWLLQRREHNFLCTKTVYHYQL